MPLSSTSTPCCRRPVASPSSFPASSIRVNVGGSAAGSTSNRFEGSSSSTREVVEVPANEKAAAQIWDAATVCSDAARLLDKGTDPERGCRSAARMEATPETSSCSLPSYTLIRSTSSLTVCTGGCGDSHGRQPSPVEERSAHQPSPPRSVACARTKKVYRNSGWCSDEDDDDDGDSTEVLQRQQLSPPLCMYMPSSCDGVNVGGLSHCKDSHNTAAQLPLSPTSPLSAPYVTLSSALGASTPSRRRGEKQHQLSALSSALGVPAAAPSASPIKPISLAVTPRSQLHSSMLRRLAPLNLREPQKLGISEPSAAATGASFPATPLAEASACNKDSIVWSPSRPPLTVYGPDTHSIEASAADDDAHTARDDTSEVYSETASIPSADHMVTPGMATTPLKLAAASVAQQERGLLSSSPRHAQHAHSPSPAGSASTEYSKKPCEQQQPSSAVRRGVRGANCGGGSHVHHLPSGVPRVIPTHDSVFFPKGTEVVAPVQLHYLTIAGWSTTAGGRDYFNHRRLRGGEIAGHTVLWLHTAKPRDQFVFLVTPVLNRGEAVPEDRTTTKAEQTQRCGPSIVAGASWTSSGGEGGAATRSELGVVSSGGSAEIHRTSRSNARMLKRWRWNKPSALLQALRTRIFGEAPWFTYRDTAAGARIRDAQVNNTHTRSAADAATVIGSNLGDLSTYNDSDIDNDGMESSSDGDTRRHHLGSPVGGADTAVSVVPPTNTDGVEAVVVAHADVTAMDYAPRLTSHRLSIEATAARTWFFPLLSDALAYYQCEEAVELIENQWSAGVTNQVPRPRAANQRYRQRRLQQSNDVSASGRGSLDRSSSVVTVPSTFPGEALLHEDGSPSSQSPSSPWMLPTTTTDTKWGREAAHNITTTGVDLAGAAGRVDRSHLSQPLSLSDALRNFKSMGNVRCGGASQSSAATATSLTAAAKNLRTQPCQHQRNSDPYRSPRTNPTVPKSCSSARDSCRRNPCNNGTTAKSPRTSPCNAADDARVTPVAEAANNPIIDHTSQPQRCHPAAPVQPRLTSSHGEVVISVYTADPVFNSVLRELLVPEPGTHPYTSNVTVQKRLLSMVEVGMPTWSILYSSTGLPYRRLFRLFYSCLTNLWPLLSLAVGLYDLYKHLPQLKRFMEHTLEPLTRWVEQRFTIRVSVLVTYLISVVVTIFGSLGSFVSQTYIVQLFYLPIVQFVLALLKLPLMIVFDTVWTLATTILGIVNVVLQVVRIVVMAPLVLVMNVASLRDAFGTALPAAAEGTSLSVKWWRSWIEFWETVASPTKNAARAWWDSMMHVSTSAARREMSIRRWYSPKLEQLAIVMEELQECIFINAQLWWSYFLLPGIKCKVLLIVVLVYLYWLFLGISPDLWDEVIHASGVRLHSPLRKKQLTSPVSTTDAPAPLSPPFPSTAPAYFYAVAHCKNDTIDACYSERNVSVSPKCANLDSSMCASLHDLPRDSGNGSSAPSAGAQPSSTVSTVKYASPTRTSGKNALTLRPESQQTFSALVAELLLPEVVLVFLHHLRGALVRGWTVAAAVTSHITAQHAKVIQINRHSETFVNTSADQTASPQCSWAETLATAYFGKHCAADAAVTTDASRHGSRVKRYINPTIVHVRWDGDEPFADPHALLRIWQAANAAKWGSVVGRETPLASPVVVLEEEPQHEAT